MNTWWIWNLLISWNMSTFLFFLRDGSKDCKLSHLDMRIKFCWFEDRKEDLSCSDESSLTDEQSSSDHAALLFPLLWLSVTACWPQRLKLTWPAVTTCVMSPRCHRCTVTSVHSWSSADSRLPNSVSCVMILSNHFPVQRDVRVTWRVTTTSPPQSELPTRVISGVSSGLRGKLNTAWVQCVRWETWWWRLFTYCLQSE